MRSELEIVIPGRTRAGIPHTSPPRPTRIVVVEAIGGVVSAALCSALVLRLLEETEPQPPIVCWAHQSSPPRLACWLQRCRIAISASQHARHHAPPHRSAYCITNGWTNRLADKLRVFAGLGKLFVAIGVPRTTAGG
jgi:hypothetical protein